MRSIRYGLFAVAGCGVLPWRRGRRDLRRSTHNDLAIQQERVVFSFSGCARYSRRFSSWNRASVDIC